MTKIKLCGMMCEKDIEIANELKPEYVGFVFAESKRQVSRNMADAMKRSLDPEIKAVGVFVHAPMEEIISLVEDRVIDCVQLHGEESLSYIIELKEKIQAPIIYAKRIQVGEEVAYLDEYPVDALLFDTYIPGMYGGSGKMIEYKRIPKMKKTVFLAGGLNSENVLNVIGQVHPYCVDVSSGIETDGKKDKEKMYRFVECIREKERGR